MADNQIYTIAVEKNVLTARTELALTFTRKAKNLGATLEECTGTKTTALDVDGLSSGSVESEVDVVELSFSDRSNATKFGCLLRNNGVSGVVANFSFQTKADYLTMQNNWTKQFV